MNLASRKEHKTVQVPCLEAMRPEKYRIGLDVAGETEYVVIEALSLEEAIGKAEKEAARINSERGWF